MVSSGCGCGCKGGEEMSATNRGRERNPRDFYRTPAWCTEALLNYVELLPEVFDPCCGDGAILEVLKDEGHKVYGLELDAASAMEASQIIGAPVAVGDYLDEGRGHPPHCDVVMNPPYRQAADFIRTALDRSGPRQKVCALLRLNFLGSSRKRIDLVGVGSQLETVIVFSRRPSFTGDGKSDACEYAFFVFTKGYSGPTEVVVS